jgi:tight adherence protein B
MKLVAALCVGVFFYFLVGYITGYAPRLSLRSSRQTGISTSQLWLLQAGVRVTPGQFRLICFGLGVVSVFVIAVLSGSRPIAVALGVFMALGPRVYVGRMRAQRLREVQEAWPDGIHDLIASYSATGSLTKALEDLAAKGPEPLRRAFHRYPFLARALGVEAALELIREELADPTSDRVLEVLILAKQRGGSVTKQVLKDLAAATTKDVKALEEMKSLQLEQRINAWAVAVLPWVVLVALTVRAGHFRTFYQSGAGLVVIAVCGALTFIGLTVMTRLAREPIEPRVLGRSSIGRPEAHQIGTR